MKFTQTTRLIAVAVLILVATAIIWWGIGFNLGSAIVEHSAWRSFAYGPVGLMRLFALAIVVPVTIAVVASVSPQARWLAVAAIALGAVLFYGDRSRGDVVAVVLVVLAAAAMSETSGTQQIVAAVVTAVVISFAALSDLDMTAAQKGLAILVRAVFFYTPLLLGPTYVERYALRRVAR